MAQLPAGTFAYGTSNGVVLDTPTSISACPVSGTGYAVGFTADHSELLLYAMVGGAWRFVLWKLDDDSTRLLPTEAGSALFVDERLPHTFDAPRNRLLTSAGMVDVLTGAVTQADFLAINLRDVAFSPDGTTLFVGHFALSMDYTLPAPRLRSYATETWESLSLPAGINTTKDANRLAVSPDGLLLSVGMTNSSSANTYLLSDGTSLQPMSFYYGDYHWPAHSADNEKQLWCSYSSSQTVRVYDRSNLEIPKFTAGPLAVGFAAFVGVGNNVLIPRDYNTTHSAEGVGFLINSDDGGFERLLSAPVNSVAIPPAYAGPPPVEPPFWTSFRRTMEAL